MQMKPKSELDDVRAGGHAIDHPALRLEERLHQLCVGIIQVLGREAPQENAGVNPDALLQGKAGQILVPHLEAGLRALTEVLRDDLIARISNVQQLERLS